MPAFQEYEVSTLLKIESVLRVICAADKYSYRYLKKLIYEKA